MNNRKVAAQSEALFQQGMAMHQQSRFEDARLLYDQVLQLQPYHLRALHLSGLIALQNGQFSRAAELIGKASSIDSRNTEVHTDHGRARMQLHQFGEALASFDKAIALNPNHAPAHHFHGSALLALEQHQAAVDSYEKAIALKHETAGGFYNLGTALLALKRHEAAIASFERAIALNPGHWDAHSNRGLALYELGQYETAVASYDAAIALKPDHASAFSNRGNALHELRRYEAAFASYQKAIAIEPSGEKTYANLAQMLLELKQWDAALANYDKAIAVNPNFAGAYHDRGDALMTLKQYQAAIASYDRAIALEPDRAFLSGTRQHARMQLCDWDDLEHRIARLAEGAAQNLPIAPPFQALALFGSAALQRQAAQAWVRETIGSRPPLAAIARRAAGGKIRIGYFSGDFREHPVSILTAELFELHDRGRFEVIAFSFSRDAQEDALRLRLKQAFDQFIDVDAKSDRDIAMLARSRGIDIAVDLGGFTQGGRAKMFALRAAPLQVGYLGYSGTMGAPFMDYLIADRMVIPADDRAHYLEQIICLPNSYLPNDSKRRVAEGVPSRHELGLPQTAFVFCCFNNSYKITPRRFDTWMRVLGRIDGSVLWLSEANAWAVDNLRREAAKRNVDPDRLIFAKRLASQPEHLARHRAADLFIDTLPYNAHTTASDALWSGLPVVTCAGDAFAGRVAASLLNAVGLPELITSSEQQYEELAVALARDPQRLAAIKQRLAANRLNSPLFDTRRYTRHLETAYSVIQDRYLRGLPPESIELPSD